MEADASTSTPAPSKAFDRLLVAILVIGALGIGLAVVLNQGRLPLAPEKAFLHSPVPLGQDWKVMNLDGKITSLQAHLGKVIFVNIWATWCGPCRQELPGLVDLVQRYRDRDDIVFLLVATDKETELQREISRQAGVPIYQPMEGLPRMLKADFIPVSYVIDRKGNLRGKHQGAREWNEADVHRDLDALLSEAAPTANAAKEAADE